MMPRLTIAQRLAVLSAVVALAMTAVISLLSFVKGRAVLTDHEIVDLGDETNLRMYELREDFRFLAREVREAGLALPRPAANEQFVDIARNPTFVEAFTRTLERLLRQADAHGAESAGNWVNRHIYLGAYFLQVDPDGSSRLLIGSRPENGRIQSFDPEQDPSPANAALTDLRERVRAAPGRPKAVGPRQYTSDVRPLRRSPTRQALSLGFEFPTLPGKASGLMVVAIDFTQMIANQARHSARHQYFIVDTRGEFVIHPNVSKVGTPLRDDRDDEGRTRFQFNEVPWADSTDEKMDPSPNGEIQRHGLLGPELTYRFTRKAFGRPIPLREAGQREALQRELEALADRNPQLRFGRPRAVAREITLSSPDSAALKEAQRLVDSHLRDAGYRGPAQWEGPIECREFAAHVVPLRLGLDETGEPLFLIVAASLEEIAHDIGGVTRWVLWVSLALCAVAALLALFPAHLLTRPLKRITHAAQRFAEGDYRADLPVSANNEIGDLARSFRDMAEQIGQRDLALRDTLARMQAVLRTAADGIITFNERGIIEEWNQAAERIFGYTAAEIKGQRIQQLMEIPSELKQSNGEDGQGETVRSLNRVLSTPSVVRQGRRKDGTTFWLELAFSAVPVGDRQLTTGIFRDVTRRVEDEERIRQMNDLLEARVRLRTAELQEAKGKLEAALLTAQAANKAKDVFVRTISHELRTPLSAVKGFTELMLNPKATKLRENPVPTLQKIHSASEYLLTLINDLLDVARVSSGEQIHLNLGEFTLLSFVATLVEMAGPLFKKNGNRLTVNTTEHLGQMRSDETRVRQILLNLLSNAAKFTEQGDVTFTVTREAQPMGDFVVFTVKDTGHGMTPEQMRDLFKPFYRVDNSTTRKQGGTGLGLSISKLLCDRMGGTISVDSRPGVGTTFTVRLPSEVSEENAAPRPAPAPGLAESAPRRGNTVLVIDDDSMSREMVQSFLQRDGFEVVLAANAEDGIRLARELRPAVITLDVMMPGADGWSVLAALKSDPRTHDIPVVMLTVADDRSRGFTLGASDYVTKPVDWDRLSSILRKFSATPAPILVVDDDALHREHMVQALSLAGWSVREASDGREALDRFEVERPAVVLLDLMMPHMDGFQFLEELRARPDGGNVPVIVVTAKDLTADERQRLNVGVARILHKGTVPRDDLLLRLRAEVNAHVPCLAASTEGANHGEDPGR